MLTSLIKPYLPSTEPGLRLEAEAIAAPLWARFAALHHKLFPDKRNGRVQRALKRWGSRRPRVFRIRLEDRLWWLIDLRHQPEYAIYQSALAVEGADDHFIRAINALVRPGDCVFDVGANRGYFTIMLRRRVGEQGQVVAVEPVELTRSFLSANLRLNGIDDVLICPVAASDRPGEAEIAVNPAALGCSSLNPKEEIANLAGTVRERIQLHRLDDLMEAVNARVPDVIKIDVEGHELPALRGAMNLLRAQPLVLFEAWPDYEKATGLSLKAIEDVFTGCGPYRFAAILWKDGSLKHLSSPLRFADFATVAADLVAWIPGKHDDRLKLLVAGTN